MASPSAARAAFAFAAFRRYTLAWLFANLASQMLGVAVGFQVYAVTHRALDLGFIGLAQFVPAFLLSLPAGNAADRYDRARLVTACSTAMTVGSVALCALSLTRPSAVFPIYGVLFFVGAARALEGPASQALVPGLVPKEHFASAVTWTSTVWQVATLVGPALGGVLYAASGGAAWVYAACAVLFALSAVTFSRIPAKPDAAPTAPLSLHEVAAGLRFVRTHPVVLAAVSLDLFAVLFGGATALLPIFATDVLGVGASGLGALRSAPAFGAAGMAVLLAYHPLERRVGAILLACVGVFGVATVLFGVSRSFPLSLAALVVLGASDMVSVVVRSALVQLRTPDAMRGRVSAVSALFIVTSSELGEMESGLTAAWLGPVGAVVLGGVGTLVVAALYAGCVRDLRLVDALEASEAPGGDALPERA